MSKVKICGLTCKEDADYVNEANADYAGFVLYFPKSKRFVTLEEAVEIKQHLSQNVQAVAVVVSPTREQLLNIQASGFDVIQIHGKLQDAEGLLDGIRLPVWRAFQIEPDITPEQFEEKAEELNCGSYAGVVLDGYRVGSGEVFDWQAVKDYTSVLRKHGRKLILAGGLNPVNVTEGIRLLEPDIADVSSGVEESPDKRGKSREKVLAFAQAVRGY